jgi:ABC-3C biological conflict system middle component
MLFPSKHDHPDQTVFAVATLMIERLSTKQLVGYDDLSAYCRSRVRHGELLFTPAISLLFLLGLVNYLPKADAFEWVVL